MFRPTHKLESARSL